jgi:hypothetical protein
MVQIVIETTDIRDVAADVVVLKHAQSFYGADAVVAATLTQDPRRTLEVSPAPGDFALVDSAHNLASPHVLFVGVSPLSHFEYQEIRAFANRTIEIIARELPATEHLAMTMHGVGYGLDEREAFLSQIAGLWEAASRLPALRKVTIAERNQARARRLQALLESAILSIRAAKLPAGTRGPIESGSPPPASLDAGKASRAKPHIFVAMPFGKELEDTYVFGIQGPANAAGFLCERVDMVTFTGDILERIKNRIQTAALVIAELTGANANVYLEVGYAWGLNRPVLLLIRQGEELKFDVKGQRCIIYENIVDLARRLQRDLADIATT